MASSNQRTYAVLVLGAVALAAMFALRRPLEDTAAKSPAAPTLWRATVEGCPEQSREEAEALAAERLRLAVAKHERSPFHPEDGVAAIPLYEAAAACFRKAARNAEADEAAADARQLKQQLEDEFRAHSLRLQRALALENWKWAERESAVLSAFVTGGGTEYADWLSNLRRKIQLSYGSAPP
jgi:hypothetical protein